jgi:5-methylcytosine-specific restriction endonuclease McrA
VKRKRRRSKLIDRSHAVECADKAMSDYIRARDKYTCVTCGKQGDKHNIDCGHFIPRGYSIWRYNEENCHAQCVRCNKFLSGNWPAYFIKMVNKYGQDFVDKLIFYKNRPMKRSIADLLEIEQYYKEKLEALNGR